MVFGSAPFTNLAATVTTTTTTTNRFELLS